MGARVAKDSTRAHGGSQRLNCQPENLQGTDLSPLHMCCSCMASCGTPGRGSGVWVGGVGWCRGAISDSVACSGDFPPAGLTLSALIRELCRLAAT